MNGSGCKDFTAYEVIKKIRREEKRQLIEDIKEMAKSRGYRITGAIRLEEYDNS